jgi:hypothetical protein
MHFFELKNFQDFVSYLFPALTSLLLFTFALGYYYLRRKDSEARKRQIIERFVGGIEGRNAPFPLVLLLIVFGATAWVLLYIVLTGILGRKI